MNISLTSKDWLYKMELLPGPVLLMLYSVLMSSTAHSLHLPPLRAEPRSLLLVAARTCSPKVKMPGFCFGTRTEHTVFERELLYGFSFCACSLATAGDRRRNPERPRWAEQSWPGPCNLCFLAGGGRFPTSHAVKAHCLFVTGGPRDGSFS